MVTHGTIGKYDGDCETWKSYTEHLVQYFAANDVESTDKRQRCTNNWIGNNIDS